MFPGPWFTQKQEVLMQKKTTSQTVFTVLIGLVLLSMILSLFVR